MNKVYLVGAGPGDPDLLTIKAQKILKKADIVLHDLLIDKKTLNYAPKTCKIICVGKQKGNHLKSQTEINNLLLKYSKKYKTIVRLKSGTPFFFGKGFEEIQFLQKHKIKFKIIPGVSAATAVPESFLIPLTYSKQFSSVAFTSGHFTDIKKIPTPNTDTVVYFMSLANINNIVKKLLIAGWSKQTPCVILSRGTFTDAQEFKGKLVDIKKIIKNNKINSPAMFMVGEILLKNNAIPKKHKI